MRKQIALADLGAFLVGAIASQITHTAAPLFLSLSIASPVVHGFHRHSDRALGSMFLHLGLTAAGAFVGLGAEGCDVEHRNEPLCGSTRAIIGVVAGHAIASAVDAAVLAQEEEPTSGSRASARPVAVAVAVAVAGRAGWASDWAPTFSISGNRDVAMGLTGAF